MTPAQAKQFALETWDQCRLLLPEHIASNLIVPASDPAPLSKKGTDIMKLRVLPRKKAPLNFWSTQWCFYEIGVGHYAGSLNVGGIAFVQFPFQKVCGSSHYWRPVLDIVQQLQCQRRSDFQFQPATPAGEAATLLKRIYMAKSFPNFPVKTAAEDLAWLISQSLPKFETLA